MSYTKRELIMDAFDELGLGSFAFDVEPEQLQSALRKLDTMMATWNIRGVKLGYPLSTSTSSSSLDQDSNAPDYALEAIITNLAVRMSPSYGKQISAETKIYANQAYQQLLYSPAQPIEMQFNNDVPIGAGNKSIYQTVLNTPDESPIKILNNGQLDL